MIYGFTPEMYFGAKNPSQVEKSLKLLYFRHLKRRGERVLNADGEVVDKPYGANLGERGFWDSMIWQKGQRIPGLYNFQARPQRVGGDPRRFVPRDERDIVYPAELLKQFALEE